MKSHEVFISAGTCRLPTISFIPPVSGKFCGRGEALSPTCKLDIPDYCTDVQMTEIVDRRQAPVVEVLGKLATLVYACDLS